MNPPVTCVDFDQSDQYLFSVRFFSQSGQYWNFLQHLPMRIRPSELAGMLPEMKQLIPSEVNA